MSKNGVVRFHNERERVPELTFISLFSFSEGWAYDALTNADSALDLAIDIQENFLNSLQGYFTHLTPKTLAIIESSKFETFLEAWDDLAGEMDPFDCTRSRILHKVDTRP